MAFQLLSCSCKVSATNCDNDERAPRIVCWCFMMRTAVIEVVFTTIEQHAVTRSRNSYMNRVNEWLSQRGCFWLQKSVVLIQSSTFFWGGAIITQEHLYLKLFISSMTFGRRQNAFSWLVWTLVLTLSVNNQTTLANLITCRIKQHPLFWCIHEHFLSQGSWLHGD